MTTAFNDQLRQGLTGTAGVIYFDDYTRSQSVATNPAAAGYSNVTNGACGRDAFSSPGDVIGNSIICNAATLIPGDTSKYAFADSVHPTPFAHQDTANTVVTLMRNAGWSF
jgi:phospholipase/lecithinase/hemolysin